MASRPANHDLLAYFPDYKSTQLPKKEFLYGTLCTLMPEAVRELIATSVKNRSPSLQEDKNELVKITKELKDELYGLYSMKSKQYSQLNKDWKQPQKVEQTIS